MEAYQNLLLQGIQGRYMLLQNENLKPENEFPVNCMLQSSTATGPGPTPHFNSHIQQDPLLPISE
uniref:Uncharacterized protein n=1 Tax=Rhizophora mucronata TaxID=61149 RepID=A0A2P2PJR5_RHIMU